MKLVIFTINKNKYNIIINLLNFFLEIHLNFALLGIQLFLYFSVEFSGIIGFVLGLSLNIQIFD
jgi:hypothetical protein